MTFDEPPPTTPGAAEAVPSSSAAELAALKDVGIPPETWLPTDLVARVRGGSRRTSETRPESTLGTGQKTVRPTLPASTTSPYQAALTLGTP